MTTRPDRRTPLGLRLLGVVAASLLLLGLVLASSRDRAGPDPRDDATTQSQPEAPATDADAPEASASVVEGDLTLLDDLDAAASAPAADLLAAGATAATWWTGLVDEAWQPRLPTLPVYIGAATLDLGRVDADIVLAFEHDGSDRVVLRFLPGAMPLADAGADASLRATDASGAQVDVLVDEPGATATLDLAGAPAGPLSLRLAFSYDVPPLTRIVDDGGPAGFGILAGHAGATMLGHWLPLLTFDPDPMLPWGDIGAFPPAVFSVQVTSTATVVTGGEEAPCPGGGADCTWARGVALRDLPVALFDGTPRVAAAGTSVQAIGPTTVSASRAQGVADEAAAAHAQFTEQLGPLPWGELDVVLVPLRAAAGMEFPGLVVVDPEYLDRLDGGFGTFVAVHEVAHQWFHALVGNSSLDDAVVDESLAQYLSHWFYADQYGPQAAEDLFDRYLVGRYRGARSSGLVDVAPASPLDAFVGGDDYGPLVYARAPLAWELAEEELGRQAMQGFLRGLVEDHGLAELSAVELRDRARTELPILGELLDRWWFDPTPVEP